MSDEGKRDRISLIDLLSSVRERAFLLPLGVCFASATLAIDSLERRPLLCLENDGFIVSVSVSIFLSA